MTAIGDSLLKELVRKGNISYILNPSLQIHPASIDLTVRSILTFVNPGVIDFTNEKRQISHCKELPFNEEGYVDLKPGAYKVIFNEVVKIPPNYIAIGLPRSSLLRSGATIICGLWDPGYYGRSEALLLVFNSMGLRIYRNARVAQLVMIKVVGATKVYKGRYQGENVD